MSIRLPLQTVLDVQDNGLIGAASTAGGIAHPFMLPQDTDGVVVKVTASTAGGGVSVILQTTDDGGTTWYDVARTSVLSNANATTAYWLTSSTTNRGALGSAAASALAGGGSTGLPLLSQHARVVTIVGAGVTGVASVRTVVSTGNQSANA